MSYLSREIGSFQRNRNRNINNLDMRISNNFKSYDENNTLDYRESFYIAIGPVIRMVQFFGIMPVTNVLSLDVNCIKFKWISFLTIFSVFSYCSSIFEVIIVAPVTFFDQPLSLASASGIIFYSVVMAAETFLFGIAMKWDQLMKMWLAHEYIFLQKPYFVKNGWKLKVRVRLISSMLIVLAIFEHLLFMTSVLYTNSIKVTECGLNYTLLEFTYRTSKSHFARVLPYNFFTLLVSEIIRVIMAIGGCFLDILIIVISIGIIYRFKQLNERIELARDTLMLPSLWTELRNHYTILSDLVHNVDSNISHMIILSCSNNMYSICSQLFNSFKKFPFFLNTLYFWYSMAFITIRLLCVLFFASAINTEARKPLQILRRVPSISWTRETERFTEQILYGGVALSGNGYFFLTKKLIFAMAGSIITYEVVLLDNMDFTETSFC